MAAALGSAGLIFPDGTTQISAGPAGAANIVTFTSSGQWTCPAGVTSVYVTMIGGGGNGGAGAGLWISAGTSYWSSGGGGGSGAVLVGWKVTVSPGTVYTVTVGAATQASSISGVISVNPGASGGNAGTGGGSAGGGGSAYSIPLGYTALWNQAGNGGGGGSTTGYLGALGGGRGGSTPYYAYDGGAGAGSSTGGAGTGYGAGGAGGAAGGYGGGAGYSGLVILLY